MAGLSRGTEQARSKAMIRIIFDTDCVACSRFAHFIVEHEKRPQCQFISAWSQLAAELARTHGYDPLVFESSFMVLDGRRVLVRSDAVLEILACLRAPWRWLTIFKFVPKRLRDKVYTILAKRRYAWFGRRDRCFIAAPALQDRFVEPDRSAP